MSKASHKKTSDSTPPAKADVKQRDPNTLQIVDTDKEKTNAESFAEIALSSCVRNASIARSFGNHGFGEGNTPDFTKSVDIVKERCLMVRQGNLDAVTDMLTSQMAALDAIFTNCVGRAGNNMGQYPEAVDRYMGIAMKAQAGCRTTAETLARIKRGGKQTVKVVHVHEGGQAVVADTVNNGMTGARTGAKNEKTRQPHEPGAEAPRSAALPGPDPLRDGVPLPSFEGQEKVPLARREEHGRSEGQ